MSRSQWKWLMFANRQRHQCVFPYLSTASASRKRLLVKNSTLHSTNRGNDKLKYFSQIEYNVCSVVPTTQRALQMNCVFVPTNRGKRKVRANTEIMRPCVAYVIAVHFYHNCRKLIIFDGRILHTCTTLLFIVIIVCVVGGTFNRIRLTIETRTAFNWRNESKTNE